MLLNDLAVSGILLAAAVFMLGMAGMLVAETFMVRSRTQNETERKALLEEQWKPYFWGAIVLKDIPQKLPALRSKDVHLFASLWISQYHSVEGEARHRLEELAHAVGLTEKTQRYRKVFFMANAGRQVTALFIAGVLGDESAIPALRKSLKSSDQSLSFTAAMALVKLNADSFGEEVLNLAIIRKWDAQFLAKILREIQIHNKGGGLEPYFSKLNPKILKTAMKAWSTVDPDGALGYAKKVIQKSETEGWLLCGALELLISPFDVSLARGLLAHPLWSVRLHAVKAINRIGFKQDVKKLTALLEDDSWWVQERVREALNAHGICINEEAEKCA